MTSLRRGARLRGYPCSAASSRRTTTAPPASARPRSALRPSASAAAPGRRSTRSSSPAPASESPSSRPMSRRRSASPSPRATTPWPGTRCAWPASATGCGAGDGCSTFPCNVAPSPPATKPVHSRVREGFPWAALHRQVDLALDSRCRDRADRPRRVRRDLRWGRHRADPGPNTSAVGGSSLPRGCSPRTVSASVKRPRSRIPVGSGVQPRLQA